jgi:hypothetical protein
MRTEKEIREKYNEMLMSLESLKDKVNNPQNHDDVNIQNIHEYVNMYNEQHSMNVLMKWILNE